jgi:type II secretory pathway pseudopilin PulG
MINLKSSKGFTLAALMVAIGVMTIMLAVAATIWSRVAQREREEELIFRGNQYVTAIGRFYRKYQRLPVTLAELSETRCIRKLYPDPMTKDGQWNLIYFFPTDMSTGKVAQILDESKNISGKTIVGVASRSTKKALRPYKDKWFYNEWQFTLENAQSTKKSVPEEEKVEEREEEINTPSIKNPQ